MVKFTFLSPEKNNFFKNKFNCKLYGSFNPIKNKSTPYFQNLFVQSTKFPI